MSSRPQANATAAPVRVTRVGGTVRTFEEPKTVWKKAHLPGRECILRLELPPGARLVYPPKPSHSWNNNKLRAERVFVLDIEELDGGSAPEDTARAPHRSEFRYVVSEWAEPDAFDPEPVQDSHGIHCFATRAGARHWGQYGYDPSDP